VEILDDGEYEEVEVVSDGEYEEVEIYDSHVTPLSLKRTACVATQATEEVPTTTEVSTCTMTTTTTDASTSVRLPYTPLNSSDIPRKPIKTLPRRTERSPVDGDRAALVEDIKKLFISRLDSAKLEDLNLLKNVFLDEKSRVQELQAQYIEDYPVPKLPTLHIDVPHSTTNELEGLQLPESCFEQCSHASKVEACNKLKNSTLKTPEGVKDDSEIEVILSEIRNCISSIQEQINQTKFSRRQQGTPNIEHSEAILQHLNRVSNAIVKKFFKGSQVDEKALTLDCGAVNAQLGTEINKAKTELSTLEKNKQNLEAETKATQEALVLEVQKLKEAAERNAQVTEYISLIMAVLLDMYRQQIIEHHTIAEHLNRISAVLEPTVGDIAVQHESKMRRLQHRNQQLQDYINDGLRISEAWNLVSSLALPLTQYNKITGDNNQKE